MMSDVTGMSESDSFAEEERTFDFGEEEYLSPYDTSVHPSMLKEYGGEDFAKYMDEDDGIGLDENHRSQCELTADHQIMETTEDEGNYYDTIQDVLPHEHQTYTNQTALPQVQPTKKTNGKDKLKWLKDHVAKATMTRRPGDRKQSTTTTTTPSSESLSSRNDNHNKIHNFSFADSKMGYSLAALIQESRQEKEAFEENADSGIGIESNDAPEVIDELPGLQRSSWWSLGTLSSRLKVSPTSTVSSTPSMKRLSASSNNLGSGNTKSKSKNSLNKMWKKVANTLSKPKPSLSIKTDEIHF